jgi:hypothetical protein
MLHSLHQLSYKNGNFEKTIAMEAG